MGGWGGGEGETRYNRTLCFLSLSLSPTLSFTHTHTHTTLFCEVVTKTHEAKRGQSAKSCEPAETRRSSRTVQK